MASVKLEERKQVIVIHVSVKVMELLLYLKNRLVGRWVRHNFESLIYSYYKINLLCIKSSVAGIIASLLVTCNSCFSASLSTRPGLQVRQGEKSQRIVGPAARGPGKPPGYTSRRHHTSSGYRCHTHTPVCLCVLVLRGARTVHSVW